MFMFIYCLLCFQGIYGLPVPPDNLKLGGTSHFQGNYSLQCVQVLPPMLMIDQAVSVPVSGEDRFRDDPIKLAIQSP